MKLKILLVAFALTIGTANAALRLPAVISDHAMLQSGKPVAIWGWATPGAKVTVAFVGGDSTPQKSFSAIADASGKWSGQLPALKAGLAGRLQITSDKDGPKTVNDILAGEVWLGGGQSNMVYRIEGTWVDLKNPAEVAQIAQNVRIAKKEADAAKSFIRFFVVGDKKTAEEPADDVIGKWVLCDSQNVGSFSAVAWNFAIALRNKTDLPVGMVVSCVGGTPVETWMSKESLLASSAGVTVLERFKTILAAGTPEMIAKQEVALKEWSTKNPTPELQKINQSTKPQPIRMPPYYQTPALLYNGMLHGLEPYTLRGIIWFQADGNVRHPLEYSELVQGLIKEWRSEWKDQLPFYFVEMNNMGDLQQRPVQFNSLSIIREQQHGALQLPATGIVGAIDVGIKNPHFPNKKAIGERLAGLALRDLYNQPGQVNSPIYQSFSVQGNKVRLKFTDAGGLRVRGGGKLKGFAIRGSTGAWTWATGKIDGQDIVVWDDKIPLPTAVRYAWATNPVISVENGAGLPLLPFRTDTDSKE